MEPKLNPTFKVGVRFWLWTKYELAVGGMVLAAAFTSIRPLMKAAFGKVVIGPVGCVVLAVATALGVLSVLLAWRHGEGDREDYVLLTWRRLVVRRGAYNVLEPHVRYRPLIRKDL